MINKKINKAVGFVLLIALAITTIPFQLVSATDVDVSQGTVIEVNGTTTENYTVTVPAVLSPGQSGSVTASGEWNIDRILTVTAPNKVVLSYGDQSMDVGVTFNGIEQPGSSLTSITVTEPISIAEASTLFGVWEGLIEYNVEMKDNAIYTAFSNGFNGVRAARAAASYSMAVKSSVDNIKYTVGGSLPFTSIQNQSVIDAGGLRVRDENGIGLADCSIFASLVIRGIDYDHSFYAKHKNPSELWDPETELPTMYASWGLDEIDKQPAGEYNDIGIDGYSTVRTVAQFVDYFRENNAYIVYDANASGVPDESLYDLLEPGDVVFQKDAQSEDTAIVHMFIVAERTDRIWECSNGVDVNYGNISARLNNIRLVVRPNYGIDHAAPIGENMMSWPWRESGTVASWDGTSSYGISAQFPTMNTIHLEGTSTANLNFALTGYVNADSLTLPAGTYKLSGMDGTGVKSAYVALQVRKADGSDFATKIRCYDGTDAVFTLEEETDVIVRLYISSGYTLDCDITPTLERVS